MTPTTPPWLTNHATNTGDDPALTGIRATLRHCRTCRRLVIAGYDAPLLAGLAICDPHPLTPQLEAAAVLLDIPTWRLHGNHTRHELTPRHEPGVPPLGTHPTADTCTVLAAHRCGHPPLTNIPLPTNTTRPTPTDPPF